MIKLSILIPMYNSEHFIERCLESILNQGLKEEEFEVRIIDNGSTDSSYEIVKKYTKTHRNIFVSSKLGVGVYELRNILLTQAKGIYVYFIDSDDYLAEGTMAFFVDVAYKKQVDVLGFETLVTSGLKKEEKKLLLTNYKIPKEQEGISVIEQKKRMRHEIWWYIIKKDFLIANSIKFKEDLYSADVLFTLNVFIKAKKVIYYPLSVYRYVQTKNSIIRNKDIEHQQKVIKYQIKMINDLSVFINRFDVTKKSYFVAKQNLKFRRDIYTFFVIVRMIRIKLNKEEVKKYINILKKHNSYPIKNFIDNEYFSIKYKVLNWVFNHEVILYKIIYLNNLLRKRIFYKKLF